MATAKNVPGNGGAAEDTPTADAAATGIAAGPEDPGGWFWAVPAGLSVLGLLWMVRGRRRSRCRG